MMWWPTSGRRSMRTEAQLPAVSLSGISNGEVAVRDQVPFAVCAHEGTQKRVGRRRELAAVNDQLGAGAVGGSQGVAVFRSGDRSELVGAQVRKACDKGVARNAIAVAALEYEVGCEKLLQIRLVLFSTPSKRRVTWVVASALLPTAGADWS